MGITVGRKGGRKTGAVNNARNLAKRANRQLENAALRKAEQYNNSLEVDGPEFYFWNKTEGSVPCSCTATDDETMNYELDPGGANATSNTEFADDNSDYTALDETEMENPGGSLDELFGSMKNDPQYQRYQKNLDEKVTDPAPNLDTDDLIDDSDIEDADEGRASGDPFKLFRSRQTNCPICLGTGYIDSWKLHGGSRIVLETSHRYSFKAIGVDVDTGQTPNQLNTHPEGLVYWTVVLPKMWTSILKIGVYNGVDLVSPAAYTWLYQTENGDSDEVSYRNLAILNGIGGQLTLELKFSEEVTFTHAELVFAFRPPFYAQLPEVAQGYEQEFLDWSVSISAEIPTNAQVEEGDYLTESKYAKVWKIGTLTPKVTVGGVIFGQSVDLRALHEFEKAARQLSLFDQARPKQQPQDINSGATVVKNVINYKWDDIEW